MITPYHEFFREFGDAHEYAHEEYREHVRAVCIIKYTAALIAEMHTPENSTSQDFALEIAEEITEKTLKTLRL